MSVVFRVSGYFIARCVFARQVRIVTFLVLTMSSPFVEPAEQPSQPAIPVKIAVFEYPPLNHTSASGQFSGWVGETIKQICVEANLKCFFQVLPATRAYLSLENGLVQALITIKFKRFEKCCVLSNWHYDWRSGIYSKHPPDNIPSLLSQLTEPSMIVVQGWKSPYTYFETLADEESSGKIQLHRANSSVAAIRMLDRNRAPYLWGGEEFKWYIEKMGINSFHFRPLLEMPIVFWVSKSHQEILKRFNQGYHQLQVQGALNTDNILIDKLMSLSYEDPSSDEE